MDYKVTETIHSAKYVTVSHAEFENGTQVIIKSLVSGNQRRYVKRLMKEYEIGKLLQDCPHVIRFHSFLNCDYQFAIIMEDFKGVDLKTLIPEHGFPLKRFLEIAIELVKGLHEIHAHEIIHKDVKPENIIINEASGLIKYIDFGCACRLKEGNMTSKSEGTVQYISPEQTGRINRLVDFRSDFYSLGITFYYMLCGSLPFNCKDRASWIYSHIAFEPVPPTEFFQKTVVVKEIPKPVSDIIMKLLMKNPEDRYQSCRGIRADLENCLQQLNLNGKIEPFTIGLKDVSSTFNICNKMYGRKKELEAMRATFDRVCQNSRPGILLITGYSGIGKTTLVNAIQQDMFVKNGYFIKGKFDQNSRNVAYSAITEAFRMLVKQILSEEADRVQYWQVRLQMALGVNGQLLIDLIPELERLIGRHGIVAQLGYVETRNRFQLVFQKFIAVFAQHCPIILFLDDMQWIDRASANLLPLLFDNPELKHFLFFGSYRSNEVDTSHPAVRAIEECSKLDISIEKTVLSSLSLDNIYEWLLDSFVDVRGNLLELCELVFEKTNGNPFFIKVFLHSLYEDSLLYQDDEEVWVWDINKIKLIRATESVIDIMISRLNNLPENSQRLLQVASCLGNNFELLTLQNILGRTDKEILQDLNLVLTFNLGYISENQFFFSHDKVQEAAQVLLSATDKLDLHSKIAEYLLEEQRTKHGDKIEMYDKIFDIVDHINYGKMLNISEVDENKKRMQLIEAAKLNLLAAQRAEKAIAYASAVTYASSSLNYMYQIYPDEESIWTHNYSLILSIYKEYSNMQFLDGNVSESERVLDLLLRKVTDDIEKAEIMTMQVEHLTLLLKLKEAIEYGSKSLATFDIHLPNAQLEYEDILRKETTEIAPIIMNKNINELIFSLQELKDRKIRAKINLLSSILPSAYISDTTLFAIISAVATNLSLRFGMTIDSPLFFVCYGSLLCMLGQYRTGFDFAEAALKIADKMQNIDKARLMTPHIMFCQHWFTSMRTVINDSKVGFDIGLETGQLQYGGYNLQHRVNCTFLCGFPLEEVFTYAVECCEFSVRTKNYAVVDQMTLLKIVINHLTRKQEISLEEETKLLADCKEGDNLFTISHYYLFKMMLYYLQDDIERAFQTLRDGEKYAPNLMPQYTITIFNLFSSLIMLRIISKMISNGNANSELVQRLRSKVDENQKLMYIWAQNRSDTFRHKYLLIEAEKCRLDGNDSEAFNNYEQALEDAEQHRFPIEFAICSERTSDFFLERKRRRLGKWYIQQTHKAYKRWGARYKIKLLETQFSHLIFDSYDGFQFNDLNQETTNTFSSEQLDLQSIFKASQIISGTIDLQTLLFNIMKIIIETAGAQKGVIVLDGKIEAETTSDTSDNIVTLCGIPLEGWNRGSKEIIAYVTSTRETLVLGDASQCVQFGSSAYIKTMNPRSILCMPIMRQNELIAVLYVENDLTKDAFSKERVQVLSILATQMAISLVNAKHYYVQIQAAEQIAEIQRKRAQEAENYRKKQDEFIDCICHEIRNPIHGIRGYINIMNTEISRLETRLKLELLVEDESIKQNVSVLRAGMDAIECCIEHQKVITDDVIALSKLDANKVTLKIGPIFPNQIVDTVVRMFEADVRSKNIKVELELLPDGQKFLGDSGRITQILMNLFANAVKFVAKQSGPRIITISLKTQKLDDNPKVNLISSVIDTGIGMSSEELSRIFKRFQQANQSIQVEYGGSGLGLFITKNLVELMGGTITVKSEQNKFTDFTFVIPCELFEGNVKGIKQGLTVSKKEIEEKGKFSGLSVMIAEDNIINRKVLVYVLEQMGCKVDVAQNGGEAVNLFEQNHYDVCFMDLVMPIMNGFEATVEIRKRESQKTKSSPLPIIGISGNARDEYSDQAKQCGFTDYLIKPVRKEDIYNVILRVTNRYDVSPSSH